MSQSINRDDLALLLADHDPPCLSLYQPTHRRYPENQQDPIRYKNLLRTLEESLRRQYSTKEASVLLDQFRNLASDSVFWNHTWDGLEPVTLGSGRQCANSTVKSGLSLAVRVWATPRISPTFLPNQESRQRSFLIASVKQEVSKQRQKIAWRRGKGRRFYAQQPL